MDYYLSNHEESEAPVAKVSNPINSVPNGRRKSRPNSRPTSSYGANSSSKKKEQSSSKKNPSDRKIMKLKFSVEEEDLLKDPRLMLEQEEANFDNSID